MRKIIKKGGGKSQSVKNVKIQAEDSTPLLRSKSGDDSKTSHGESESESKMSDTKSESTTLKKGSGHTGMSVVTNSTEASEKIPDQVKPRPHFERSICGKFPLHLLNYAYEIEPVYCTYKLSSKHTVGATLFDLDFSHWTCIGEALNLLIEEERPVEKLFINDNVEVTDSLVTLLLNFSTTLQVLHISFCSNISSKGIRQLMALSSLTNLNVSGLHTITDEIVEVMCQSLGEICHLNIGSFKLNKFELAIYFRITIF